MYQIYLNFYKVLVYFDACQDNIIFGRCPTRNGCPTQITLYGIRIRPIIKKLKKAHLMISMPWRIDSKVVVSAVSLPLEKRPFYVKPCAMYTGIDLSNFPKRRKKVAQRFYIFSGREGVHVVNDRRLSFYFYCTPLEDNGRLPSYW